MNTRKLLVALLVGVCALDHGQAAQTIPMGVTAEGSGIEFSGETPLQELPQTGFMPIRINVRNRTKESHTWQISFGRIGGGNRKSLDWATSVTAGAGESRSWDLLVPKAVLMSAGSSYENMRGTVSGYGISSGGYFMIPSRYVSGNRTAFVAMTDSLATASWSKLDAAVKAASPSSLARSTLLGKRFWRATRTSGRALSGSEVVLNEMPPDWRAFSGIGGLWVKDSDWEKLSSDRRRAIRTWVNAGGRLFVGTAGQDLAKAPLLPEKLHVGTPVPVGFGGVELFSLEKGELPVDAVVKQIFTLEGNAAPAWQQDYESTWSLADFVGWPQLNVPLIIGFVCLFGLVIGPINLRVFAPPQRRNRLFLTVPLISVCASLVLALAITIGDGFGGFGGRNAVVYLGEGENTAVVIQEQIARTRLLMGRDFKLAGDIEFASADANRAESDLSMSRNGDGASGDWFRSRSVQSHYLRATVPSRAEVTVQKRDPDGAPTLLSSVAGALTDVIYLDPEKRAWRIDRLETGRPAKLLPASEKMGSWSLRVGETFSENLRALVDEVIDRPGSVYAIAEQMPEAPIPTLGSINWQRGRTVCFGPVREGGAK